ncbi:hypothetical protein [Paraburkholderia sp. MM5477-R1]
MDESHQTTNPGSAGLSQPGNSSTPKSDDNDQEQQTVPGLWPT